MTRRDSDVRKAFLAFLAVLAVACAAHAREREPLPAYAARRAKLRATVTGPVVLFGYTGKEEASPSYVFNQEEDFYYLTGHNEPGAALLLVPDSAAGKPVEGPKETVFLPARNLQAEKWNSPRLGPDDSAAAEKIGIARVMPFSALRGELERLAAVFPTFYSLIPGVNDAGYPHVKIWHDWLKVVLPQTALASVAGPIHSMRQIKSESELALLQKAIDLSVDAHIEAMRMMRPGLYEYELAARMEYIHKRGGCETEGYAPIVGAGFNSTVLHYNAVSARIRDGDIVVLDVAGQYSGYSADITRTLPSNGKFSSRQRAIYEIVLGAQNAAIAAVKPGATMNTLNRIAREYIDSHGSDKNGNPLGRYLIHGISHHIGLNVHDPGDGSRLLESGMVITIEPGIYIPEENLGVRIEDDILVTPAGSRNLSARAPRTVEEVEKLLSEPRLKP